MTLFDRLVDEAIHNTPTLSSLRNVVEKELLHHDILRIMRDNALLSSLTFMGGTCLRDCYSAVRLSEDLDFTGGFGFEKKDLEILGKLIIQNLQDKYAFPVSVSAPEKDSEHVSTWKIKIETRAPHKHLPAQRINIDICALPSYDVRPRILLNRYGIDMGTSGLIIQAQSREEIYTDKLIAFALRKNRIKYRDLWDISWLHGQGISPLMDLIVPKLLDRGVPPSNFLTLFEKRTSSLNDDSHHYVDFQKEMNRFLPTESFSHLSHQDNLWLFIAHLMTEFSTRIQSLSQ